MSQNTTYTISEEDSVTVDFKSELMENYFPESTINAHQSIKSIMAGDNEPIVFSLDNESRLQALVRVEASATGWVMTQISKGPVASFDVVFHKSNQSFRLAMVENGKAKVSNQISIYTPYLDQLNKILRWESYEADSTSETINLVSVGLEHVLFASQSGTAQAQYYLVDLWAQSKSRYTLPEAGDRVIQLELGNFEFTKGVFVLYEVGNDSTLLYQSFPDRRFNRTTQRRLNTEGNVRCFSLLEGENDQHMIYTGGDGVHEFRYAANQFDIIRTKLPGDDDGILNIKTASQDDEVSVWTMRENGLNYQTNRFFDQQSDKFHIGEWTDPLVMDKEAEQFSCVKGKGIRNQLFTFNSNRGSNLNRLWQDAVTTLWNKHEVHIEAADSLREVECYASHIRFRADTGVRTFNGLKVKLSADSHLFVYVNATSYHIGPNEPVEIELDFSAEFTVICPVKDLACALLFVEADFLERDIVVNPADNTMKKLETEVSSGEALGKIKKQNGESLVSSEVDTATMDEVVKAVQDMVKAANDMYEVANPKAKAEQLAVERMVTSQSTQSITRNGTGSPLGDLLFSVRAAAEEVASFVVNVVDGVVEFAVTIGNTVMNWVVNTVREIGSAIQSAFEAIVVFFEDLFEFLAFLFGWQGILEAKDALKDFTNNAMSSLQSELGNIRTFITDHLDDFIDNFAPELNNLPSSVSEQTDVTKPPPKTQADPTCNWANSKTDYIGQAEAPMPPAVSGAMEEFLQSAQHIMVQLGEGFTSQIGVIGEAFQDLIHGRKTFLEFLQMLLNRLIGFSLFLIRQLLELLLRAIELMIGMAKEELNRPWHIPLISPLYRFITRSPDNPNGSQLSFLDFACLLVAIPSTIAYRIGEGREPFTQPNAREAYAQRGLTAFKLDLN